MDAAAKHENRYRAVIEYANGAMFNVAELDAWATSNKVPVSFETLLKDEHIAENYSADRHFVHYSLLSITLASRLVPESTEPSDAVTQLMAAGDAAEFADPVRRLRELVMVRYDRLLLCAVYDGDLNLYDTLMYAKVDVTAARLGYDESPDAFLQSSRASAMAHLPTAPQISGGAICSTENAACNGSNTFATINEQIERQVQHQPALLYGEGFSEEMRKLTTLSQYLEFDTWTPEAAAMLVSGLQPPIPCAEIPEKGAMGLDNCFIMGNQDPFHNARRVLELWRSRENAPARVRPIDFIAWCKSKGIDTSWLRTIEESSRSTEARTPMRTITNFSSRTVVVPNVPLLTPDWLAREIAFAMVEIPDDWVIDVGKKEVPKGNGILRIEPLATADFQLVRDICGSNPPLRGTEADFKQFEARFNEAESKLDWDLHLEYRPSDAQIKARNGHNDIYSAHREKMAKLVRESKLSLITTVGTDTTEIDEGCIRLADAKAYLDQCCIAWEVASVADPVPSATKPEKSMTHNKPNWNVWHRMLKASLFDAVCLSCNVSPGAATLNPIQNGIAHLLGLDFAGWDVSREIEDRLSIARSHAGTGGTLPTLTGDTDGEVYLATFAEWAVNTMEWSVPDELRAVAHAGPSDAGLDSLAARVSTEDADDAPGTRSVIGWRIAVEKQLDKLMTAHGGIYPGHKAALKWFKANDAEAAFVPDNKDDEFTWVKADGKRVTSALKTFQNGMADILKSRQIPD